MYDLSLVMAPSTRICKEGIRPRDFKRPRVNLFFEKAYLLSLVSRLDFHSSKRFLNQANISYPVLPKSVINVNQCIPGVILKAGIGAWSLNSKDMFPISPKTHTSISSDHIENTLKTSDSPMCIFSKTIKD